MTAQDEGKAEGRTGRRWFLALLPVAVAAVVGAFLFVGLGLKPREIPSALIGKAVPKFDLPPIDERPPGLASSDLSGEVSLVNVFASWCVSCRAEHPLFMELAKAGTVPIHGLNYKDKPEAALNWLRRLGDPYQRVGADRDGRVGINFGVYGVPETFLIGPDGTIVCKHIGPVRPEDLQDKLLPAVAALRANKQPIC
jgi:cytochrome c biogenesis protein CcmG/thiol:disulfide interchange protein DsbE